MPTESRTEQLLNAYINGDDISNFVPLSRNEQILKDMILGNEQTLSPQSRIESLYQKLDEKIKEGSGGGDNPLQYFIDNHRGDGIPGCQYLLYYYKGTSLDDVMNNINTSKVTVMKGMFGYCSNLTTIPQFNTSSCTDMSFLFNECSSLKTIPLLDTSKVTNMEYMFYNCEVLTTIPQLDTSSVTRMYQMFYQCSKLTTIPLLDTSKVTNMYQMFYQCSKLTTIPQFNTSSCTDMGGIFQYCKVLTTIPQLDTSKVIWMSNMFTYCSKLTTITQLDMNSATNVNYIFSYCYNLSYLKLLNVRVNLQIGSGTSWGHLIEKDCLIQIISELIKPSSGTRTLTMGTANTAKLADTYVKLLEDDGTGKYPFEVCKSTDEGAMTITDYCTAKNWTLA